MVADVKPLVVIVGPTASGKTNLAIDLAQQLDGEIISADSRAIYRQMNIGTAKPSRKEQQTVQHWGIDLVDPDERFTVADFQKYANAKIAEIRARGKLPILVGGSGLYVDSVIFNYQFDDDADDVMRQNLAKMTISELQNYCKKRNILLPENDKNKRYLIRAIERKNVVKNNRQNLREHCIVVGLLTDKEVLKKRIAIRIEAMFNDEIEKETKNLAKKYSFDLESMKSNVYPIVWRMINGEISREQAMGLCKTDDWHLAKKQMTWFRRNPYIKWLPLEEVLEYVSSELKKA